MSISSYLIRHSDVCHTKKITFIIISVLKKLAESSYNKLDNQLVDIMNMSFSYDKLLIENIT